jgi:phenylpropionate dioxygenase-like ring-hydroxylating dioxygenase large terminal subunit
VTASLRLVDRADPQADLSLPAWVYRDAEFFEAEKRHVLRPSWQAVCHLSDIPEAGSWHSLDFIGESIIVVRGEDGVARGFTNICRHRGSRIVDGASGCAKKLVCPYHAWTYELDGRLSGVPAKSDYPALRLETHGLHPVETETWQGFVFVRLEGGGPSVAEMMAPHMAEIAPYRFEALQPLGPVNVRPRAVNWKNIGDNYSDNLHVPIAHPGLKRLFGQDYFIEAGPHVDRLWGDIQDRTNSWSERLYRRLLPRVEGLDDTAHQRWLYFKLWPNFAFELHPDTVCLFQWLPLTATTSVLRDISYGLPDGRREMKAARYLNTRINRLVNAEDTALITRVQAGMDSASFAQGPIGESEVCLRSFAARMRRLIPAALEPQPPAPGWSRA